MELVDIGLYLVYLLIAVAALSAIIFPLIYVIQHPKEAKDILIGFSAILVIFLVSYLIASDNVLPRWSNYGVGPTEAKFISAGLISFYILVAIAIVTAIYAEISKFFK
jgi:hypothetical protein